MKTQKAPKMTNFTQRLKKKKKKIALMPQLNPRMLTELFTEVSDRLHLRV